jgi:hypothetical protein
MRRRNATRQGGAIKRLALAALSALPLATCAQSYLQGHVRDAGGKPLAGASIFISNTSKGTVTDEHGSFLLTGIPSGRYILVISSVGYQTDLETIDSRYPRPVFDIVLRTKVAELGEVTVRAFDKDGYKRWGELFRENFIGTSDFARNCRILNPEVIKIHYAPKSQVLEAYSDGAILVENRDLGYDVQVTLDDFRFEFATQSVAFSFFPLFTEMQGSPAKKKRWAQNRATAYYGSALHFFRALYQDRVSEEGFSLHLEGRKDSLLIRRLKGNLRQALAAARDSLRAVTAQDSAAPDAARNAPDAARNAADAARDAPAAGATPEALLDRHFLSEYDNLLDDIRGKDPLILYPYEVHPAESIIMARDSNTVVLDWDMDVRVTYLRSRLPDRFVTDYILDPHDPAGGRKLTVNRNPIAGMSTDLELLRGFPMEVFPNGSYMNTDLVFQGYWTWWQKIGNLLPYDYQPPQ